MKELIKKPFYWLEDKLKECIGELTPDKRIVLVITMLLLFTALSLYFSFSSIYRFGKGDGKNFQIQHIERLELELDSIKTNRKVLDLKD